MAPNWPLMRLFELYDETGEHRRKPEWASNPQPSHCKVTVLIAGPQRLHIEPKHNNSAKDVHTSDYYYCYI